MNPLSDQVSSVTFKLPGSDELNIRNKWNGQRTTTFKRIVFHFFQFIAYMVCHSYGHSEATFGVHEYIRSTIVRNWQSVPRIQSIDFYICNWGSQGDYNKITLRILSTGNRYQYEAVSTCLLKHSISVSPVLLSLATRNSFYINSINFVFGSTLEECLF